jgi:hypothetical protein
MPNKINAVWHEAHRMPKNASLAQRVEWHKEHASACACRPIPSSVQAAIDKAAKATPRSA